MFKQSSKFTSQVLFAVSMVDAIKLQVSPESTALAQEVTSISYQPLMLSEKNVGTGFEVRS